MRHSAAIEAAARVSREIPLRCARSTAVVVIDMQTFCCDLERGGCWRDGSNQPSDYLRETLPAVVDNIATLLQKRTGTQQWKQPPFFTSELLVGPGLQAPPILRHAFFGNFQM